MQTFNFGRDVATLIDRHASVGASQVQLGRSTDEAHVNVVYLEAGGVLGEHEAPTPQLFVVVDGAGWVSSEDGEQREVSAGMAILWSKGELHAAGTATGMTAVIVQALELEMAAPQRPVSPP